MAAGLTTLRNSSEVISYNYSASKSVLRKPVSIMLFSQPVGVYCIFVFLKYPFCFLFFKTLKPTCIFALQVKFDSNIQ